MVVPFAAYISYVDLSVRPLIHVRGCTHRSDPVSTKNSIFVTRSLTKRRLVLGPSLFAAFSVGTPHFPTDNCMVACTWSIGRQRLDGTVAAHCWRLWPSSLPALGSGSRYLPYRGSGECLGNLRHLIRCSGADGSDFTPDAFCYNYSLGWTVTHPSSVPHSICLTSNIARLAACTSRCSRLVLEAL